MSKSGEKCLDTWLLLYLEFYICIILSTSTYTYSQECLVNAHFFGSFFPESPLLLLDPPLPAAVRAGTEVEAVVIVPVETVVVVWVGNNWEMGEVIVSDGSGFVAEDVGGDEEVWVVVEG